MRGRYRVDRIAVQSGERVLYPYVVAIVTIPMVAMLPILMFWTGFGMTARVVVVICQVVPIVTLQSLTGFSGVEKKKVNLGLSVGASKLTRFVKIVFPNALPYVFTGMRLGSIFATTATISAELISSSEGLGNRVIYFSKLVATESTFACILLIAAIGVTWFLLLSYIEKKDCSLEALIQSPNVGFGGRNVDNQYH